MNRADMKMLSRQFYEKYDQNDRQALASLLAPGCVIHLPGAPQPLDRDAFLKISALFAAAFTESQTCFEDEIAEDDTTVTRWVWQITHSGEFMGVPPTGRRIAIDGMTINRFAGGTIVEQWVSFDQIRLLEQIGALR